MCPTTAGARRSRRSSSGLQARQVTEEEIIAHARTNLAHYKCPTSVEFVDELPRNATGKISKRDLREPFWQGHDRRIG